MTCNVGIAERSERLIVALRRGVPVGLGVPYVQAGGALGARGADLRSPCVQRMLHVRRQAAPRPGTCA